MSLTLCAVVAVVAVEWMRQIAPHHPGHPSDPFSCVGSLLVICGVVWRSWAAATLVKGEELATEGPYACCRHPLYVGSFLILLGYCVLLGEIVGIAVPVATVLMTYPSTILGEERRLAARFPAAWSDYVRAVPAFFPRRLPRGVGPVSWRRWLRNREYWGAVTAVLGLWGIEVWHALLAA